MEENKNVQEEKTTVENNVVPTTENNNVPKKNNNGIIALLVIIILLMAGALVYLLFFNKPKEELKDNNPTPTSTFKPTEKEETTEEEQEEPTADYSLYVYITDEYGYSQIFGEKVDNSKKVEIKVQNKDAKFITGENDNSANFFLYDDNGIKLYDIKNKKSTSLDIGRNYKDYRINTSEDYKSVVGISYTDSKGMGTYYNLKTKTEMYKGKYKPAENYMIYNISDKYLSVSTDTMTYLLSATTEKVITSNKNDKDDYFKSMYASYGENGKLIYALENCYEDGCTIKKLYNDKIEEFYSGSLDYDVEFSVYKNAVYLRDGKKVKKYDFAGKLVFTSGEYYSIESIENNYVVYTTGDKLMVENIDDMTESVEICSWKENWDIDFVRYYDRELLDTIGETNKKEGLYVVFYYGYNEDGSGIRDGKGYYGMEYCYTPDKQIVDYPIKQEMGGRAKPVLYLYPKEETKVTVKFEKPNLLTTTYPKYINSWNVTVKPNGDMYDADGKYYYALYWDETRYSEVSFKEGFYVESRDAIKFLEEKLTIIGLNDKERNEFIMYWLPIMEKNGKNLVYFELTEERESGNKLIIEPKPDSLLRVSIHIKKVNNKVNIKEQKLTTFNRIGFTAVEWGGMTY